jgi:hypothetical protein
VKLRTYHQTPAYAPELWDQAKQRLIEVDGTELVDEYVCENVEVLREAVNARLKEEL